MRAEEGGKGALWNGEAREAKEGCRPVERHGCANVGGAGRKGMAREMQDGIGQGRTVSLSLCWGLSQVLALS